MFVCYSFSNFEARCQIKTEFEVAHLNRDNISNNTYISKHNQPMRSADYVVPARFIVTLGHVLAIVMAMYTISDNVETTIGVTESLTNVNLVASTTAGANLILYISLGTALFDICGLVSGYSMFQGGINVAHIMLHFLGSVYTSWFIMYQWNITTLWYIFVPFGLLPFLIELSVFIRIGCCNADLY